MRNSVPLPLYLLLVLLFPIICLSRPGPESTLPPDGTDLGKQFRDFVAIKEDEVRRVTQAKGIDAPSQTDAFFAAVHSKQWAHAESLFEALKYGDRSEESGDTLILSSGIQDVSGVYDLMGDWNEQLIALYTDEALRSVPDGSIVFGGTAEGRYLITYGAETLRNGKVTVVTQNALADNTYVDYLRYALGERISIFPIEDSVKAFQTYVEDVKAGRRDSKGGLSIERGRVRVEGVLAVMDINGILARTLVEQNQDAHSVYVEESYVIDWMYEYLTPHGLIMKLNRHALDTLPQESVRADQAYWKGLESKLEAIPTSSEADAARKAFSKCRSAIGGLYSHHDMSEEAEAAFRQALRLCPTSPEANFRLADLLKHNERHAEAEIVLAEYMDTCPLTNEVSRINNYIAELRELRDGEQTPESDK